MVTKTELDVWLTSCPPVLEIPERPDSPKRPVKKFGFLREWLPRAGCHLRHGHLSDKSVGQSPPVFLTRTLLKCLRCWQMVITIATCPAKPFHVPGREMSLPSSSRAPTDDY